MDADRRAAQLARLREDPDADGRRAAATALAKATEGDPEVVAALVAALEDPGYTREDWIDQGAVVGWTDHTVSYAAAIALAAHGVGVLPAVLAAVEGGGERSARELPTIVAAFGADALATLDDALRIRLRSALEAEAARADRWHVRDALACLDWADGTDDRTTTWIRRLDHPRDTDRRAAIDALRGVAPAERPRVGMALFDRLLSRSIAPVSRRPAVAALASFGAVLDDARVEALFTQVEAGALDSDRPELLELLRVYEDRAPERLARRLLSWMYPAVKQRGRDHRGDAAAALARLDVIPPDVRAALVERYLGSSRGDRALAERALGGPPVEEAHAALAAWLSGDEESRARAFEGLSDLGEHARPFLDALCRDLTDALDAGRAPRPATLKALASLGPAARPALPQLIRAIDAAPVADYFAVAALARVGEAASAALAPLERLLARERAAGRPGRDVERALRRIRGEPWDGR